MSDSIKKKNLIPMSKTTKKFIDLGNGMAWWSLGAPFCEQEGEAMEYYSGSMSPPKGLYDDLLSLRTEHKLEDNLYYEPHVTSILNTEYGILMDLRGKYGKKPDPKYHPAIVELLKHPSIKVLSDTGYDIDNNFHFNDLCEEHKKEVITARPDLVYDEEAPENIDKILDNLTHPKFVKLHCAIAMSEDLTSEQITKLIDIGIFNVHFWVAKRPQLSREHIERLVSKGDYRIIDMLVKERGLSLEQVQKILNKKQGTKIL